MAKINLDKYYTPASLAEYCVKKAKEVLGGSNIAGYIEPSAGAGVFLQFLDKPFIAYDIEPEADGILAGDYLATDIPHTVRETTPALSFLRRQLRRETLLFLSYL